MIKTSYFLRIIIFLSFIVPVVSVAQSSVKQRKDNLYADIVVLELNPERLFLKEKNKQHDLDSIKVYYNEIVDDYGLRKDALNKAQNIAWLYEISLLEIMLNKMNLSIVSMESALEHCDKYRNPQPYKTLKMNLGNAYRMVGKKAKSNEIILEALELPLLQEDTVNYLYYMGLVSENYEILGEFENALDYAMKLYNIHLEENNLRRASYCLIQMGRIASYLESDTTYFEYFHKANSMAEQSGERQRIGNNLSNTGLAYQSEGYYNIALKYLLEARTYSDAYQPYGKVYNLLGLSSVYFYLDSIPKSFYFAKQSLKIANEIDAYTWIYESSKRLASCYEKLENYDSSAYYLLDAIVIIKKLGYKNHLSGVYKHLSELYVLQGDYSNAVLYLDSSYRDYIKGVNDKNEDKLAEYRVESDYFIHKSEITDLILKNKLEKEKSKRLRVMIIAVVVVLLLTIYFTILIRRRLRQLRESYVSLVKKNIELDKLNLKLNECEIKPEKKTNHESNKNEEAIIKKLKELLYRDEVFTNPDLSLKLLAGELLTNTSYLSAAVNSHFHCNLPSLINKSRIDKARKMLVSSEFNHYSMEGIATEVGFKSRSSFYHAFKTVTGLSPSLYIENYKIAIES